MHYNLCMVKTFSSHRIPFKYSTVMIDITVIIDITAIIDMIVI